ncbi:MAG: hypothetical protein Q4G64_05285 [bacterium]|nr:hypothetical protein [bacterium]
MTQRVTGLSARVAFDVPENWIAEQSDVPEVESFTYLPGPQGSFAPNAVLTLNEYEGGISEFLVKAMDSIRGELEDVVFVDVARWTPASREDSGVAGEGRSISYTHRSPRTGMRLRVDEWLLVGDGLAAQLTTTAGIGQWGIFGPVFAEIAHTLRFLEGDRLPESNPIPETARDELASELAGTELERIHGLTELQPFPYEEGQWIRGASVKLLADMAEGLEVGSLMEEGLATELAELGELGLMEGTSLTDDGVAFVAFFESPNATFRLTRSRGDHQGILQAWIFTGAVLISTHGDPEAGAPSDEYANIMLAPVSDLSTLIAKWVGLQPAWSFPVSPDSFPAELLAERESAPEGADAALQAVWDQEWTTWDILASGPETGVGPFGYLNAGRMGHYLITPSQEHLTYRAASGRHVLDTLEEVIQATLYGRLARVG